MARRMNAENDKIYRAVAVTQWLDEQGKVTNETTDVYGPYPTKGAGTFARVASGGYYGYASLNYYKRGDGSVDYSRPRKRVLVETQVLSSVVTLKSYSDGRQPEYGSELVWVKA